MYAPYPKSELKKENLVDERGISLRKAESIVENKDRIGNLQLVPKTVNRSKSNQEFSEWIKTRDDDYGGYIPEDNSLYEVENFPRFVEERENKMINEILEKMTDSVS